MQDIRFIFVFLCYSNYEQLCSTVEVLSDRIQSNPRESARKCIKKSRKRPLDEWESDANEPCTACLSCASPSTVTIPVYFRETLLSTFYDYYFYHPSTEYLANIRFIY